jgi:hypothetical protein
MERKEEEMRKSEESNAGNDTLAFIKTFWFYNAFLLDRTLWG